jgi:hypothetical protein
MPTCSFISDERGVTEPFTDLPALGIVSVGLIVFAYLMLSAYSLYASSAYYSSIREDLLHLANTLSCDPALTDGRPGLMDVRRLNNASDMDFSNCGYPGSTIRVTVEATGYKWSIGDASVGKSASYRLPVSIMLNDARSVPGTLTVTMWAR